MLFSEFVDARLGVLKDQAIAAIEPARIAGQRLGASVKDSPPRAASADDGREDVQCAIGLGGHARCDHHAIIKNTGAGAVLGRALELANVGEVWGSAGRDDARVKAQLSQPLVHTIKENQPLSGG